MKNILSFIIIGLFLISFASAVSIGTFKSNQDVELYQTCNNCTYCNFTTIKYPNGTNILTNVVTTKDNTYYSYNLDGGNTTDSGIYRYCYDCGNAVESTTGCVDFKINPSGLEVDTEDSIANGFVLLLLFGVSVFFLLFARTTEQEGVKLFFSVIGYLMLIFAIGGCYILLQNVQSGLLGINMGALFVIGIVLIVMMYYIFINLTRTSLALWKAKKGFESELNDSTTF